MAAIETGSDSRDSPVALQESGRLETWLGRDYIFLVEGIQGGC